MERPTDAHSSAGNTAPLDYARPTAPARGRAARYLGAAFVVLLVSVPLFIFLNLPLDQPRSRAVSNPVRCASNMRQMGIAIEMYANGSGGRFPDDLGILYVHEDISAVTFTCPSSNDTPAPPAPTTQATATALLQPGHCSYIYLGKGLTDKTIRPDMVLLYEPLADHGGTGMNVMFGDFHVEWIYASAAQTLLTQHAASTQPIRLTIDSSGRHASIQR